eukprot:evm.model.NODE_8028_length_7218_cov_96.434608.2
MQVTVSELKTVLLGNWNPQDWAIEVWVDGSRDKEGKYPLPRLTKEHEYRRCGGGFDVSDKVLMSKLTTPFSAADFMDYLSLHGFTGDLLVGTAGQAVEMPDLTGRSDPFKT